jgi:hypothetical protein
MIRYKNNPVKSNKIIEVDGKQYQAKYIGKGKFSKVYRIGNRVIYYTRGDCTKEVLAMFQYERIAHLSEIIRHDNIRGYGGNVWYVFSSPYYRNVTRKDRSAYELMKDIVEAYYSFRQQKDKYNIHGLTGMENFVKYLVLYRFDIPRSVVRALQEIVDIASNCGNNVLFDFHNKNFGVNEYGTLIFRDPIYVMEN